MPESPVGQSDTSTSIGFGGGEVVIVNLPLEDVAARVSNGMAARVLLEFKTQRDGVVERIVINPYQVKVLQEITDA